MMSRKLLGIDQQIPPPQRHRSGRLKCSEFRTPTFSLPIPPVSPISLRQQSAIAVDALMNHAD